MTPERIEENIDIFDFELSEEEMDRIEALDRGERTGPDPDAMSSRRSPARRVAVMQHERVAVGVLEVGHVADAAVDVGGGELDAA